MAITDDNSGGLNVSMPVAPAYGNGGALAGSTGGTGRGGSAANCVFVDNHAYNKRPSGVRLHFCRRIHLVEKEALQHERVFPSRGRTAET